jgi:hypothetical protein
MRCQKCGRKTQPIVGRVIITVGDASLSLITDVGHCEICNLQVAQFNYKIEPLVTPLSGDTLQIGDKKYNA